MKRLYKKAKRFFGSPLWVAFVIVSLVFLASEREKEKKEAFRDGFHQGTCACVASIGRLMHTVEKQKEFLERWKSCKGTPSFDSFNQQVLNGGRNG